MTPFSLWPFSIDCLLESYIHDITHKDGCDCSQRTRSARLLHRHPLPRPAGLEHIPGQRVDDVQKDVRLAFGPQDLAVRVTLCAHAPADRHIICVFGHLNAPHEVRARARRSSTHRRSCRPRGSACAGCSCTARSRSSGTRRTCAFVLPRVITRASASALSSCAARPQDVALWHMATRCC